MTLNYQKTSKGRGIEWTDATWNPIAGCPHQCRWTMPDGAVAVCYAESIAEGLAAPLYPNGFAHHYWRPQHLSSPGKVRTHLKIFTGSMSDIFAQHVPSEQIKTLLDVIRDCPQHTFQFLTKNPVRAKQFGLPDNIWLGASMPPDFMWGKELSRPQQERMLRTTMKALSHVDVPIKWMSFEPLSWDVAQIIQEYDILNWAVIGAASDGRKQYPPDRIVFDALEDVLSRQNVPVFYKGNLRSLLRADESWREEYPVQAPCLEKGTQPLKQMEMFSDFW